MNLIIVPTMLFSLILGIVLNEMPIQLFDEIETGYNRSTFDVQNKNPLRYNSIKIDVNKETVTITVFQKRENCAKNSHDWTSPIKCLDSNKIETIDCSIIDVNQCVALTYEKYQY